MEKEKIKRLYELRQKKKRIEDEEATLSKEIKEEMKNRNQDKVLFDGYEAFIKIQNRIIVNKTIIGFLENLGYAEQAKPYYKAIDVSILRINFLKSK